MGDFISPSVKTNHWSFGTQDIQGCRKVSVHLSSVL